MHFSQITVLRKCHIQMPPENDFGFCFYNVTLVPEGQVLLMCVYIYTSYQMFSYGIFSPVSGLTLPDSTQERLENQLTDVLAEGDHPHLVTSLS